MAVTANRAYPIIDQAEAMRSVSVPKLAAFANAVDVDVYALQTGKQDAAARLAAIVATGITAAMFATNVVDNDSLMAANSNTRIPTQAAVKAYADGLFAANDAMVYKGAINASTNPNYPAADAGHLYRISVAGKIGGASGPNVEVGDTVTCIVDGSAAGNHATVGANWNIVQANLDGAVIGPASSVAGRIPTFSGTSGKLLQDSGYTINQSLATTNAPTFAGATLNGAVALQTSGDQYVYFGASGVGTLNLARNGVGNVLSFATDNVATFPYQVKVTAAGAGLLVGPGGSGTTNGVYTSIELGAAGYGGMRWRANGSQVALEYYDIASSQLRWAVGATDPVAYLTSSHFRVNGSATINELVTINRAGTPLALNNSGGGSQMAALYQGASVRGSIGADATNCFYVFDASGNVRLSLSQSGSLNMGAGSSVGAGAGQVYFLANGGNSGTNGGAAFIAQGGGSTLVALGNISSILGGAYDGRTAFYAIGNVFFYTGGSSRMILGSGLAMDGASGGDRGAGTINATAVYDDNALLSCYVFDAAIDGDLSLAKWDEKVPDRQHAEQVELVTREVGRGKDAKQVQESRVVKETWTERRQHDPARWFKKRLGSKHDPLTLEGYERHWREKRHLTAFPNEERFDPVADTLSTGEWVQRLIEDAEIKAVLVAELHAKVRALEAKLAA